MERRTVSTTDSIKRTLPWRERFLDCTDKEREFEFSRGQQTDGVVVKAIEINPDEEPGYSFSSWSSTLGDALGRLRSKISTALARRHIGNHPNRGLEMLAHDLSGQISCGGIIVDGRFVSFDKLLEMLQVYEGWEFELSIKDGSE